MSKPKKKKRKTKKQKSEDAAKRAEKRKKDHAFFDDPPNAILHFARVHSLSPCPGGEDNCNYGKKLKEVDSCMDGDFEAAVHHILPVSAVIAFRKIYKKNQPKLAIIKSVYAKMEWCINKKDNLMWLPYFGAYQRHLAAEDPDSAPKRLAAHDFDHNPKYNDLVINILKEQWETITAETEVCQKAQNIVAVLTAQIPVRRTDLETRLTPYVLTTANKMKGESMAALEKALPMWWLAFSMAPGASKKKRPHSKLRSGPPERNILAAIKRATEAGS